MGWSCAVDEHTVSPVPRILWGRHPARIRVTGSGTRTHANEVFGCFLSSPKAA